MQLSAPSSTMSQLLEHQPHQPLVPQAAEQDITSLEQSSIAPQGGGSGARPAPAETLTLAGGCSLFVRQKCKWRNSLVLSLVLLVEMVSMIKCCQLVVASGTKCYQAIDDGSCSLCLQHWLSPPHPWLGQPLAREAPQLISDTAFVVAQPQLRLLWLLYSHQEKPWDIHSAQPGRDTKVAPQAEIGYLRWHCYQLKG